MKKMNEKEASRFFDRWYYDPDFVKEREDLRRRYDEAHEKELDELCKKYKNKHLKDFLENNK